MPAAKRHSIGKEEGSTDPIIIEHIYIYIYIYISNSSWTDYNHKEAKTKYDFIIAKLDIDRLMGFFFHLMIPI